jgi:hypothetical protein
VAEVALRFEVRQVVKRVGNGGFEWLDVRDEAGRQVLGLAQTVTDLLVGRLARRQRVHQGLQLADFRRRREPGVGRLAAAKVGDELGRAFIGLITAQLAIGITTTPRGLDRTDPVAAIHTALAWSACFFSQRLSCA